MKSLHAVVLGVTLAVCSLTVASAQISGTAGGEGSGSSNNPAVFSTNPQNIGVNVNTASAAENSMPAIIIALIVGAAIGAGSYATLTRYMAK